VHNPHNMKVIMEGWRRYCDDALLNLPQIEPSVLQENRVLLFEAGAISPSSEVPLTELLEQWKREEISADQYVELIERSTQYEYDALLKEGLVDILKSAANATIFRGKSEEEIAKLKATAREKMANFVVIKLWVRASSFLRAQFEKVNKSAGVLLADLKQSKISQSKMGKIATSVAGGMGKIVKAVLKLVGGFAKMVMAFMAHPIVKWTIIVLCALVLLVSIFNSAVFVGALGFAPAFAGRKLGIKAGVKVGSAAIKATLFENVQLLKEFVDIDVINTAIAEILSTLPEAGETSTEVMKNVIMAVDTVGDETEKVNAGVTIIKQSDQLVDQSLSAVRELQRAAAGGSLEALDMSMVGEETQSIIKNAIKVAKAVCGADEAMCTASEALVGDFQEWYTSTIHVTTEKVVHIQRSLEEFEGHKTFKVVSQNVHTNHFVNPLGVDAGSAADISGQGGAQTIMTKGDIGTSIKQFRTPEE